MDESRRCTATSKQSGERCKRAAIPGGTVCAMHGGKIPRVQAAAERRLAEQAALAAVTTYGLPREVDPHDALLEELHRTAGHVAWLGSLIAELEHQESVRATVMGPSRESDPDDKHVPRSGLKQFSRDKSTTWEKPSVWVELYQWERKHLGEIARECIKAGIEERRVQLAEQQGKLLAQVISQIVTGLGHDLHDEAVQSVVRPALQLVRSAA